MKISRKKPIVLVGAGNVGLQAIEALALALMSWKSGPMSAVIVDFDRVEPKDVTKGYHRRLIGAPKAAAAAEQIRLRHGKKTARCFRSLVAAAESVPGLLRNAAAVCNGTDSNLAAAYVSEQARNVLEIRMSTGMLGDAALHTLEVLPPGLTLADASYDKRAWADAARYECRLATPLNSFSGIAQPFGSVTGALAVHLLSACLPEGRDTLYQRIRIAGPKIRQIFEKPIKQRAFLRSRQLACTYDQPLNKLWQQAAAQMAVSLQDLLLEMPTPIVTRHCSDIYCRHVYQGFERQPPLGRCEHCGAETCCTSAPRDICLDDVQDIADRSLQSLHTPAGLGFEAWSRDGRKAHFHLPFRFADVPGRTKAPKSVRAAPIGIDNPNPPTQPPYTITGRG